MKVLSVLFTLIAGLMSCVGDPGSSPQVAGTRYPWFAKLCEESHTLSLEEQKTMNAIIRTGNGNCADLEKDILASGRLELRNQQLTTIAPIVALQGLKVLDLTNETNQVEETFNKITDMEKLAGLTSLQHVELGPEVFLTDYKVFKKWRESLAPLVVAERLFARRGESVTVVEKAIEAYDLVLKHRLLETVDQVRAIEQLNRLLDYRAMLTDSTEAKVELYRRCQNYTHQISHLRSIEYFYWRTYCGLTEIIVQPEIVKMIQHEKWEEPLRVMARLGIASGRSFYEYNGIYRVLGMVDYWHVYLKKQKSVHSDTMNAFTAAIASSTGGGDAIYGDPLFNHLAGYKINPQSTEFSGDRDLRNFTEFSKYLIISGETAKAKEVFSAGLKRLTEGGLSPFLTPEIVFQRVEFSNIYRSLNSSER